MKRWVLLLILLSLVVVGSLTVAFSGEQDEPKAISMAEYNKRVGDKNKTTLAYFHADWCGVCKKMKPVIDRLDTTNLEIVRIDTEKDKEIAEKFEVSSLPILILYHKGVQKWIYVGLINESELLNKINGYVVPHGI